jgi:hypothetical protein
MFLVQQTWHHVRKKQVEMSNLNDFILYIFHFNTQ